MANVGFVGLGMMGGNIVARLLAAGHAVTGFNRTRSKTQWLIDQGMRFADSPAEVCAAADVVISMVTNSTALSEIAGTPNGILAALKPGHVWIDMSTVAPAIARELAEKVRAKGAGLLDAPVSGSPLMVQQGKASIMVGGGKETFERVQPLLLQIGAKVTYIGGNGMALVMKLAINLSLAVQMLAYSEGVLLAEKSGIPRDLAVDVLTHSAIASPLLQFRGPFVLNMPEEAWFNVNLMQKDMGLAMDLGREVNVPLPTTATANEYLSAARALGLADRDFAIVFEVLARMAGLARR